MCIEFLLKNYFLIGGPGTKLHKRLTRGDPGINGVDRACKEHDIAYSTFKNVADRNIADKILGEKAWERFKSSDATPSIRAAAIAISSVMKAKSSLGMGLGSNISSFFNPKKYHQIDRKRSRITKNDNSIKRGFGCGARKRSRALTEFDFLSPTNKKKSRKIKKAKMVKTKKVKTKNIPIRMWNTAAAGQKPKKKKKKTTIKAIFREARTKAKEAIQKKNIQTVEKAVPVAEKAALAAVNRITKKSKKEISPLEVENELRVMQVPKTGGVLPLIPIFAGLSALGALMGGSASITNAVLTSRRGQKDLHEATRHNQTMEAIALGQNANTGSGLYLSPYKTGLGLFLSPTPPNQQLFQQKNV